jgi:galactokinase
MLFMSEFVECRALLRELAGPGEDQVVAAPGRVNLIGEHIDYHNLPVMPIAMRRAIHIAWRPRTDRLIRAVANGYGQREFYWNDGLTPAFAGDWENYLRAAAQAVAGKWGAGTGIDAAVTSDLPPAAGLSSSSALIVAVTLALLRARGVSASFEELMEVLPDGEHFVGTRGGGMDHAASLDSRAGCASLIEFAPVRLRPVPVPADWAFLVSHSMTTAEKSGAAREEYNVRRAAGYSALVRLGFSDYRQALAASNPESMAARLDAGPERDSYLHTITEAIRVREAVNAMERSDAIAFGDLLNASHASLRDRLKVSTAALDRLTSDAVASGALGARLTGAGFGGCAVVFCRRGDVARVRDGLVARYYAERRGFDPGSHLILAEPGPGALHRNVTE